MRLFTKQDRLAIVCRWCLFLVFILWTDELVRNLSWFPILKTHQWVCICVCVCVCIYISLLSSFHSLSYDKSMVSSKANSPQSAIYCFNFQLQCPLVSLKPSSCLRHRPFPLATSTLPSIFPSRVCFRRQIVQKMCSVQLSCLFFIVCLIFLSFLTMYSTSSFLTRSVQLIFSILLQHHISELSRYFRSTVWSVQVSAPYKSMIQM